MFVNLNPCPALYGGIFYLRAFTGRTGGFLLQWPDICIAFTYTPIDFIHLSLNLPFIRPLIELPLAVWAAAIFTSDMLFGFLTVEMIF